jgi:hypothetical protein
MQNPTQTRILSLGLALAIHILEISGLGIGAMYMVKSLVTRFTNGRVLQYMRLAETQVTTTIDKICCSYYLLLLA